MESKGRSDLCARRFIETTLWKGSEVCGGGGVTSLCLRHMCEYVIMFSRKGRKEATKY